ncbi:aldo/keto reductase [Marininema halotolerans]|uniref:Aldo/keto reductase n=1 Tax=Marininema halotolerans TaxID=1155944 RepID=A0A1I6PRZ9_9BACL|nr:aldo/keto reductase [Marininema halotolerans]SFS42994.1 Aldo/keto reductase [Marininema halotolerans]
MNHLQAKTLLHNGVEMPWFGLGVYKAEEGSETENAVRVALNHGYRHIDTASLYGNEESVGRAIRESSIPQNEIFVTTKIWNADQGYDETLYAFEKSQRKLNMEPIDLYLIHWPVKEKYKETWRAMERLYEEGQIRAIGVSNFHIHHLEDIMSRSNIPPMVNQVELHPRLTQKELLAFCKTHHIQLEAWSPLMRGRILDNNLLQSIAQRHNKTVAQIILRWDLQNGIVTIPKSVKKERILSNADVFDFELNAEEMSQIDHLHTGERTGQDPDHFHFNF